MRNNKMYKICLRLWDILNDWVTRFPNHPAFVGNIPNLKEWNELLPTLCLWIGGEKVD